MRSSAEQSVGEGAFRQKELQRLCAVCGEPAPFEACPRCQSPLCASHAVSGDERCASCQEALDAFVRDREHNPVSGLYFLASLVLGVVAVMGTLWLIEDTAVSAFWVLPVALVAGFLPGFVGIYRQRRVRPVFLAETPAARRLRLPPPRLDDEELDPRRPIHGLAIAGFVLSLLLPVPGAPFVGVLLAIASLYAQRAAKVGGQSLAWAAILIGSVLTFLHIALLALPFFGF